MKPLISQKLLPLPSHPPPVGGSNGWKPFGEGDSVPGIWRASCVSRLPLPKIFFAARQRRRDFLRFLKPQRRGATARFLNTTLS